MENIQLLDKYEIKISTSKQSAYSDNAIGFYHKIMPKLKKLTVLSGGLSYGSWIFGISKYQISPIQYAPNQLDNFVLINRIYSECEFPLLKELVFALSRPEIYDPDSGIFTLNPLDFLSVVLISDPNYSLYNSYLFEINNLHDLFGSVFLSSKSFSEYSSLIFPQNKIYVVSKENIESMIYFIANLSDEQKQILPTQIHVSPCSVSDFLSISLDELFSEPIPPNSTFLSPPFVFSSSISVFSYYIENNSNIYIDCVLVDIYEKEYQPNTNLINKSEYIFDFQDSFPIQSKNSNIINPYFLKFKNKSVLQITKEQLKNIKITFNFR
ncbi:MAG: hypothetical protein QXN68_00365 [Thermoplasmata archaeon]